MSFYEYDDRGYDDYPDNTDYAFEAALADYQAQEQRMADERQQLADEQARRPQAIAQQVTFAQLVVGDYMTAEPEQGPAARWVRVEAVEPGTDEQLQVTFCTPQPLGLGMHDKFTITRDASQLVTIDRSARAKK